MRPSLVIAVAVALIIGAMLVTISNPATDSDLLGGVEPIIVDAPAPPAQPSPELPAVDPPEPTGVVTPPPPLSDDDDDGEPDESDDNGGDDAQGDD